MTHKKYQRLFQLNVFHSYFPQDICRCLEFNAEAATEQLMKRFRFLIRRQVNGFGLYSNSTQTIAQLLQYIEQATGQNSFSFEIRTNNPDFNFFTELPANWVGQLIYDSQNSAMVNNKLLLNQYLSANAGTLCLGKVTLRFKDILQYNGQAEYTCFEICFAARATQWQYFVINKSQVLLTDPAISGKDKISFDGPVHVTTATGQAALLFSSGTKLIPLSEESIYSFDLLSRPVSEGSDANKKALRPKIVVKGLPNPNPQWIGRTTEGFADQLSSPMYIYL